MVVDWAAWCAMQLAVPLELLHVLERHPERGAPDDLSGAIGLGAQEHLLKGPSELDARRSMLAQGASFSRLRVDARPLPVRSRSMAGCVTMSSSRACWT